MIRFCESIFYQESHNCALIFGKREKEMSSKVVILTTGGTIDKEYPRSLGGYGTHKPNLELLMRNFSVRIWNRNRCRTNCEASKCKNKGWKGVRSRFARHKRFWAWNSFIENPPKRKYELRRYSWNWYAYRNSNFLKKTCSIWNCRFNRSKIAGSFQGLTFL